MDDDGPIRRDELRDLIRPQYANDKPMPAKMQIFRELERQTSALETESAKALRTDPVHTEIRIRDTFCVVSMKADSDATATNRNPSAASRSIPAATAQQAKVPPPQGSRQALKSTKEASKPSWVEMLLPWIDVARKAAEYFFEAKKTKHESS